MQRGRWSIDAGRLVTSDVVTDAHAMDGNTSTEALAKASAQMVDAMSAGKPAASEVLRLDARRLTLRPADVDRPAGHRLSAVSGSLALATVPGTTYDGFRNVDSGRSDARSGPGCCLGGDLLLTGCTGLGGGGETPKRPPLNVADQVQQVDRSKLVGTWQCRELNPYPEMPKQTTTHHLRQGRHALRRGPVGGQAAASPR